MGSTYIGFSDLDFSESFFDETLIWNMYLVWTDFSVCFFFFVLPSRFVLTNVFWSIHIKNNKTNRYRIYILAHDVIPDTEIGNMSQTTMIYLFGRLGPAKVDHVRWIMLNKLKKKRCAYGFRKTLQRTSKMFQFETDTEVDWFERSNPQDENLINS